MDAALEHLYSIMSIFDRAESGDLEGLKKCIELGVNPNQRHNVLGRTPVLIATLHDHLEIVNFLIQNAAGINIPDYDGKSPLYWAAEYGRAEMVERLLRAKADENQRMHDGSAPLHAAANSRSQETLEALVKCIGEKKGSVDLTDNDESTALHLAASAGWSKGIEVLLGAGGNVNSLDRESRTPLILAAIYGGEGGLESIRVLLQFKASLEIRDTVYRQCALSYAAEGDHREIVELLIKAGCVVYSQQNERYPPLFGAVWGSFGNHDLLKLFFELKSDEWPDEELPRAGAIAEALYYADKHGRSGTTEWILAQEHYLTASNEAGRTVLSLAASNGYGTVVEALLNKDLDLDTTDKEQRTALSLAAERGHHDIVGLLLGGGARVNSRDNNKRTPLSWAAASGNKETVQLLLDRGTEPDSRDSDDRTPLSWAAGIGSKAIIRQLLSRAPEKSHPSTTDGRKRAVFVDSTDRQEYWTPLWYAALGGHFEATETLLEFGANALTKDVKGYNLMDRLNLDESPVSDGNLASRSATRKLLEPYFSLMTQRLSGSDEVDDAYSVISVGFLKDINARLETGHDSLDKFFNQIDTKRDASSRQDFCLKWLHLPANNMIWVEILMAKHYKDCGDQDGQRRNLVLRSKLWTDNQNIPHERTSYHQRFMTPSCHSLPLMKPLGPEYEPKFNETKDRPTKPPPTSAPAEGEGDTRQQLENGPERGLGNSLDDSKPDPKGKNSGSKQSKPNVSIGDLGQCNRGLVLFMPYLHWEPESGLKKLKDIVEEKDKKHKEFKKLPKEKQDPKRYEEEIRQHAAEKLKSPGINKLNETEKLLWRYLDEEHPVHIRRTLDQYYYPNSLDLEERDQDQTTLRYYRDYYNSHAGGSEPVLTMVDQLWMWVLPKCGPSPPTVITAFPQRSHGGEGGNLKWMTALVNSILSKCEDLTSRSCFDLAKLIVAECSGIYFDSTHNRHETPRFLEIYRTAIGNIMDNDVKRFRTFQENIKGLDLATGLPKSKAPKSRRQPQNPKPPKEARDEIGIQDLLDIEDDMEDLRRIKDIRDELNMMTSLLLTQNVVIQRMGRIIRKDGNQQSSREASREEIGQNSSLNSPQEVVTRNLEEVKRLDDFAGRAAAAIDQLLELKQKQADLLLTNKTYEINDATDKQGKTLLMFTIVTIIFLPLSFMASFLALDVTQFPRVGDKLSLGWVVEITLSVSLPLSAVLLFIAFNLDGSQRQWIPACLSRLKLSRRNRKEKHVEEGGDGN